MLSQAVRIIALLVNIRYVFDDTPGAIYIRIEPADHRGQRYWLCVSVCMSVCPSVCVSGLWWEIDRSDWVSFFSVEEKTSGNQQCSVDDSVTILSTPLCGFCYWWEYFTKTKPVWMSQIKGERMLGHIGTEINRYFNDVLVRVTTSLHCDDNADLCHVLHVFDCG